MFNQNNTTTMRYLCITLFSLLAFNSHAQVMSFDWAELKDMEIDYINEQIVPARNGDLVMLKLENINLFLYQVELKGESFELQTPIPSELQTLFRLPTEELYVANESADKGEELSAESLANMSELDIQIDDEIKMLTSNYEAAEAEKADADKKKSAAEKKNLATANANLKKAEENLEEAKKNLDNANLRKEIMDDLVEDCEEYLERLRVISGALANLEFDRAQLVTIAKEDIGASEARRLVSAITEPVESRLRVQYREFRESYGSIEQSYRTTKSKMKAAGASDEDLKKIGLAEDGIENGYHMVDDQKLLTVMSDVLTLYRGLNNKKNFEVTSAPVQVRGDYVEFEVNITPSQVSSYAPFRNPIEWNIRIPAWGGWKIDFSVGPTFSVGSGAVDETFYLAENADGTTTLSELRNDNVFAPSVSSMMHVYRRSGRELNWGMCFGVGAGFQSIEDIDFASYAGLSVLMGEKQKFIISGGASFLRVERLESQYETLIHNDTAIDSETFELNNITGSVFRPSVFLGVSFAIAQRNRSN